MILIDALREVLKGRSMDSESGNRSLIGYLDTVAPARFSPCNHVEAFWHSPDCIMQLGIIVNCEAPAKLYGQLRDWNYGDSAYNRVHLWRFTADVLTSPDQPYAKHARDFVMAFRMKRPFTLHNYEYTRIIQILHLKSKISGPYRDRDTQFALEHTCFRWGRLMLRNRNKRGSYRSVPFFNQNTHNVVCTADESFIPFTALQSNVFEHDMFHLNGGQYYLHAYPFIRSWIPAAGRAFFFYLYWALRALIEKGVPAHVINDRFVLYLAEWDPKTVWLEYNMKNAAEVNWVATIKNNTCLMPIFLLLVRMIERNIPPAAIYRMCLLNGCTMLNLLF